MKRERVKIFTSIKELADHSALFLKKRIEESRDGSFFTIALPGGSTPKKIFRHLAEGYADKINWDKVRIFWGDERCVPIEDSESNHKMAYDTLLKNLSIPKENIFRIRGESDPVLEAKRYGELIKDNIAHENGIPIFDLIILGLGEDGHIASIFPDQLDLFYSNKFYEKAKDPKSSQDRITITGKIINHARHVVFLVTGQHKADIVSEIIEKKDTANIFPASLVSPFNGELIWMIDTAAAQLLDSKIQKYGAYPLE